jgi:DNA polymerase
VPGALEVAQVAAGCATWADLAGAAAGCTACPELAATRTTVVVGDPPAGWRTAPESVRAGSADGRPAPAPGSAGSAAGGCGTVPPGGPGAAGSLILVGEAPGADEDRAGRPFVGRAGRLLDELLAEAGLDRAGLAVLNVLQCRPPGNRPPKPAEIARCRGWLDRKLGLLGPGLICALGRTAAGWFLGPGTTLAAARGRVHEVAGRRVIVTYHPSAAIRYGPAGEPIAGLRADLALIATLLGEARGC